MNPFLFLLLSWIGYDFTSKPVNSLHPQSDKSYLIFFSEIRGKVEAWILSHATLFLFIAMALLIALFVVLMMALVGVSATESGAVYNHFSEVI